MTLTITVENRSGKGGTPTGDISVLDGGTTVATVTLRRGKATIKKSSLPEGRNSLEAIYSGTDDFAPSAVTIIETVQPPRSKAKVVVAQDASRAAPVTFSTTASVGGEFASPMIVVTDVGAQRRGRSPLDDRSRPG